MTVPLSQPTRRKYTTTPFKKFPEGAPPESVEPPTRMPMSTPARSGDTVSMSTATSSAEPPTLTVDLYAQLCAETAVFPNEADERNLRYGVVDEAMRRALDKQWLVKFKADPDLRAAWKRKLETYKARLRGQ
jgi:hypothetical protein